MSRFAILLLLGIFLSHQVSFNLESKYGDGTNIDDQTLEETDYTYLENLLDINFVSEKYNNLFFYTQLEYTSPPLIGFYNNTINQVIKKYYFEYIQDKYSIKIGDLNYLSGFGLAINTYQDHTLDFDNMLRGIETNYSFNDNILIRAMIGSGKYNFRSIASLDSSDFFYDKETKHFEIQYNKYFDYDYFQINNITYSYLSDKSFHYKKKRHGTRNNRKYIKSNRESISNIR